jgi:hypothetical protein
MRPVIRRSILGLLLCAAATGFCQSTANDPQTPDLENLIPQPHLPARDFSALPPNWSWTPGVSSKSHATPLFGIAPSLQPRILVGPKPQPRLSTLDQGIDPQMIIRPPKSSLGAQEPGAAVAKNEYPGLRLRPIQSPASPRKSIPTR